MNKKIVKSLLRPIAGKKILQRFFENLHLFSIYCMNYGNGSYIDKSGELNALKYIRKKLRSDKTVLFDVGANVGDYSRELKKLFGESCEIHSFEPSAATYKIMKENVSGLSNVFTNNMGMGEKINTLKLYTDEVGSGKASVYERQLDHINITMHSFEEVAINTIDAYSLSNNIGFIDFLKLDVEGHELKVLEGAERMLRENKIHFIQFEFGGCNIDSRTYFQNFYYLLKEKYKIYRILVDGLLEINEYKETMEIFTTVNYLAELKHI